MKRAALYVRVSTQEQKNSGLSVDSQIDALKKYCEEQGYTIAGIYNDAGISARKKYTKRPALLQLLEDCKKHEIDIILFTRLDRWFRAVAGYYEVQRSLMRVKCLGGLSGRIMRQRQVRGFLKLTSCYL